MDPKLPGPWTMDWTQGGIQFWLYGNPLVIVNILPEIVTIPKWKIPLNVYKLQFTGKSSILSKMLLDGGVHTRYPVSSMISNWTITSHRWRLRQPIALQAATKTAEKGGWLRDCKLSYSYLIFIGILGQIFAYFGDIWWPEKVKEYRIKL